MVECNLPKVDMRVRFPLLALLFEIIFSYKRLIESEIEKDTPRQWVQAMSS